ncbi:MAG: BatA domain-containing protein [Gemmatimonadetes bacterium]|nr:BatA domain-containing protein [Gemmatimonadota bacterium]
MLLAPLWLAGLVALGLPLLLHLWSRRPARVLRVGTTRHLTGLPPVRRLAPRLTEPWLLLLRLAVVTALVLALAEPLLRRPPAAGGAPIVLVAPAAMADSLALRGGPAGDALRQAGAEARLLAGGFPPLGSSSGADDTIPPWDRLAEADRRLPAGRPFIVIAAARPEELGARRPLLGRAVTWIDPRADSPSWAIEAAWARQDSLVLRLVHAAGRAGERRLRTVPGAAGTHPLGDGPAVEVRREDPSPPRVRLLGAGVDGAWVTAAAPPPLAVGLAGFDRVSTARLRAAATVLGEASGRPVELTTPEHAELVLAADSAGAGPGRLLVPAAWLPLATLPDSLLGAWPLPTALRPAADLRRVPPAQAMPDTATARPAAFRAASLRLPLLWLALLLLLLERVLAARPARGAA